MKEERREEKWEKALSLSLSKVYGFIFELQTRESTAPGLEGSKVALGGVRENGRRCLVSLGSMFFEL